MKWNLLMFAVLAFSASAQAEMFKCKDDRGRAVYQEQPCENSNLRAIGTVKKPGTVSADEVSRMEAEKAKTRSRLDAQYKAEQEARAEYEKRMMERRRVEALEDQARAQEQQARKPTVEINIGR